MRDDARTAARLRRFRGLFAILACVAMLLFSRAARAASDPSLRWYTIETPHYRVTYHDGCEEVAQRVANVAESMHGVLTKVMAHEPAEKTEIILADFSEAANGAAVVLPYNAIRLIVTAPEDLSPLGDVDDWYLELVTHENTHVLHVDNIHGLAAIANAIIGKTYAPNQVQPRWILEGIGVYHETARTSGGRNRSSMWNMFLRADALEDNLATLDQMSNPVRRWPQGNIAYLYGSKFVEWIAQKYGEDYIARISRDYGGQIIPWGINRSIRRTTGKTYEELYPEWIEDVKRRAQDEKAQVLARGLREGKRITFSGQVARYPRWIPDNAWPEHKGGILYYRDDQRYRTGLFAVDVERDASGAVTRSRHQDADLVARTSGESYATFAPDGSVVFGSQEIHKNVFLFSDLERLPRGKKSAFGTPDGGRIRLTDPALRATDPAVSPGGDRVVFVVNRAGTRSIHIADLEEDHVANVRPLLPTERFEQAFTPRWSPDGKSIAYGVWKRGGYRDIRYVDLERGVYFDVTNDRAVDGGPAFTPDGRFLLFHSDRTGIMNVYAWEIATGRLMQVTNVINGAYSPDVSPDGKTLVYVGYTKAGFDLFAMPFDESRWLEAPPYVDTRPPMPAVSEHRWEPRPYSAWPTLLPRRFGIQITEGSFGRVVIMTAAQSDLTGFHSVSATSITELEKPELQGSLSYAYTRLPFDFSMSLFRTITPRGGYQLGEYKPIVVQETAGISSAVIIPMPRAYDSRSLVLSHSLARVGADLPFPIERVDPHETPAIPPRGYTSSIHVGYVYTNAERYVWSVGPERGYTLSFAFDWTDEMLGSQFNGFSSQAELFVYYLMPWARHHSLALHGGGGTSGGQFPGRGAFYVGSFVELPIVDVLRNQLIQGGITLRGYPPVAVAGRSYALANAEYRFPIVNVDRGPSTLPIFLNRINGNVFFDYGSAFESFGDAKWKSGVGAELWFDMTLGYVAGFTFRTGYARGLASGGMDKVYFVAAVPY